MTRFLRLWMLVAVGYVGVRLAFNLLAYRWIDLTPVAFLELGLVPLGQTIVLWLATRGSPPARPG